MCPAVHELRHQQRGHTWPDPVSPLIGFGPDAQVEGAIPWQVGAQALAELFDPAIFGLGDFATDEVARGERCAGPPVAGREPDCRLDREGHQSVFDEIHLPPRIACLDG